MTAPGGLRRLVDAARQPLDQAKDKRDAEFRRRVESRQARWEQRRLAVPYRTDGPKITLGVLWCLAIVGGAWFVPPLFVLVVVVVAVIAALQSSWAFDRHVDPVLAAIVAGVVALSGVLGALALGVAILVAVLGSGVYVAGIPPTEPVRGPSGRPVPSAESMVHRAELLLRSGLPAGVAAGSLIAVAGIELGALLALVALVSAYEVGDFLIGTGSQNALEGPIAGVVALAVVSAVVFLLLPAPFDPDSFPAYAALVALAAPAGQIAASAALPRGAAWAPALRRLDSYLVAAPLWLLLVPRP